MGRLKNNSNAAKRGRAFLTGVDSRRNVRGQTSGDQVELSALLRGYLVSEGLRDAPGDVKKSRAEALATKIWTRALAGDFHYVQFLADRIMGRVVEKMDLSVDGEKPDNKLIVQVVHSYMAEGNLEVARKRVVESEYGDTDYDIPQNGEGRKKLCLKKIK